ncbi:MAG: hypothetical protein L3J25_07230 [Flavobacteriaceae bacterium]|nr:hypothetical protein [Flavobacteriaceae bacterium]
MKKEDIEKFLNKNLITFNSVKIVFFDNTFKVGYFENIVGDENILKQGNKWRFVENNNALEYKKNNHDPKFTTVIEGNLINFITNN